MWNKDSFISMYLLQPVASRSSLDAADLFVEEFLSLTTFFNRSAISLLLRPGAEVTRENLRSSARHPSLEERSSADVQSTDETNTPGRGSFLHVTPCVLLLRAVYRRTLGFSLLILNTLLSQFCCWILCACHASIHPSSEKE